MIHMKIYEQERVCAHLLDELLADTLKWQAMSPGEDRERFGKWLDVLRQMSREEEQHLKDLREKQARARA